MTKQVGLGVAMLIGVASGLVYNYWPSSKLTSAATGGSTPSREQAQATHKPIPQKKLIIVRKEESMPTSPVHPQYDPALLIRVQGGDAKELFDLEPRQEEWAQPFEEQVNSYISDSFEELGFDSLVKVEVECHTAICLIEVDLSELDQEEADIIDTYLTSIAPLGDFTQSEWTTARHLKIHTMLSPVLRTSQGYSDFIESYSESELVQEHKQCIDEKLTGANL